MHPSIGPRSARRGPLRKPRLLPEPPAHTTPRSAMVPRIEAPPSFFVRPGILWPQSGWSDLRTHLTRPCIRLRGLSTARASALASRLQAASVRTALRCNQHWRTPALSARRLRPLRTRGRGLEGLTRSDKGLYSRASPKILGYFQASRGTPSLNL